MLPSYIPCGLCPIKYSKYNKESTDVKNEVESQTTNIDMEIVALNLIHSCHGQNR